MSVIIKYAIIFVASYLLGSVNTSIIAGKLKSGEDIRNHGSGNAGATNALRTFGKGIAALVVVGDALKAVIAIVLTKIFVGDAISVYVAGIGVALGHNFPIFFGFRGGKGIVVSAVACLFADWRVGLLSVILSIAIIAVTKFVSLGSIIGAILVILLGFAFRGVDVPYIIFAVILCGLAIIRHRNNIVRLIHGTENKLRFSKEDK